MQVALVIPGSLWYAPYVRIYTRILDEQKVKYAIISWNREGDDKPEGLQYNVRNEKGHGSASFKAYRGYIKFIKKTIKEYGFDRIIVFGPQMTCMLSTFLLLHFRGRYMIDYRDLSIEQRIGFRQLFSLLLKFSRANVISSPGFKHCLPKRDYLVSHNFVADAVKEALNSTTEGSFNTTSGIEVLTIGAIRDLSSNMEVVKSLANIDGVKLNFVGKGGAAELIADYCKKESVKNVSFSGFYQKNEEAVYVQNATFMNIFYPRKITHDTALSNRFYNSLIYKKPMIVTKGTTQGYFAEKYQVGIAIVDCNDLKNKLDLFLRSSFSEYASRCNDLLKSFLKDEAEFRSAVIDFINSIR